MVRAVQGGISLEASLSPIGRSVDKPWPTEHYKPIMSRSVVHWGLQEEYYIDQADVSYRCTHIFLVLGAIICDLSVLCCQSDSESHSPS